MSETGLSDKIDFENTMENLFQLAIKSEWNSRRFYIQFSRIFDHVPEVSHFWLTLANDEEQHAKTLQEIQDSLSKEILAQEADRKLIKNIMNILSDLSKISIDQVKNLDDAYEIAHEIETSEVNNVFRILTENFIADKNKKETIISDLLNHVEKLMKLSENYGNKTWRKEITPNHLVSASHTN